MDTECGRDISRCVNDFLACSPAPIMTTLRENTRISAKRPRPNPTAFPLVPRRQLSPQWLKAPKARLCSMTSSTFLFGHVSIWVVKPYTRTSIVSPCDHK
jgi:hypothetical protein